MHRLATGSAGETYANPKALAAKFRQLRGRSRRVEEDKHRAKARVQVARLNKQVADTRRDAHNKAACAIVDKRPSVLVIEDRNVKGMVKNRRISRAHSDAALGQVGRILTYMAEKRRRHRHQR